MNLANSRFTISTMAVAACAMVALVAAESVQAQTATPPVQRIVIVGKRLAAPEVQRVVIVGQRPRAEPLTLSAVASKPAAL